MTSASLAMTSLISAAEQTQLSASNPLQTAIENNSTLCIDEESCTKLNKSDIEVITVIGSKYTPISVGAEGSYTLDDKMLQAYKFGNGNLNDILAILPGVQYGEAAYAANQVSNIKPSEVSIAGSEGYQSGYQIDGVSNNSKLSTGSAQIDQNLAYNVSGHSQEAFVNLNILDSITVYDSNIPAKYGQFSGGLVLAETQNAGDKLRFGVSYRTTKSDFVKYHELKAPNFDASVGFDQAIFEKEDISAYLSAPLSKNSGIVAQVQMLDAAETLSQLGTLRLQSQTNYNGLIKYHHKLTKDDEVTFRYLYAPYQAEYFDTDAINSDYDIDGGGQSFLAKWQADREFGFMETQFDIRYSENSKTAPNSRYIWRNVPGKAWGGYNLSLTSLEGSYGDIDKTQTTASFKQDFSLNPLGKHEVSFGYQVDHQSSVFDRKEDSLIYNSAVISPEVDCNGYTNDCVETGLIKTIAQIEAELGRPLDFTNIEDVLLYEQNIAVTGQYFQRRQISPKAEAKADINYFAAYISDYYNHENWDINLGLRYEYNDFFENHNIAPRFRVSYEVTPNHQLIMGANRYYESDLIGYKLNQAMTPVRTEIRKSSNNVVQQWQAAQLTAGYRYEYVDTKTPYSDELSLAYRQNLLGGRLELKWLGRQNDDSINRVKGYNEQGQPIMYAANNGSSEYERFSLSWMANFGNQHIEFNISKASNKTSKANFDGDTTLESNSSGSTPDEGTLNYNYDEQELVFLRKEVLGDDGELKSIYTLITTNDLSLEKQDANRPVVANISWGANFEAWQFSAFARYMSSHEAIYPTGGTLSIKDASQICDGCITTKNEYDVYRLTERPAFWQLSGSIRYHISLEDKGEITVSFEGENLLNDRTYQVSPYTTGLELGRRFWLGVSYNY